MAHDVFICHASEDKDAVARPLAEALRSHNVDVWYDEFSLTVGDSLSATIDRGLESSRFAIVVISPAFFSKPWTNRELAGIVARETVRRERILLPVWHDVDVKDVLRFSPPLADLRAVSSSIGVDKVATVLLQTIHPNEQPLPIARTELERYGWETPPFSDEWWLDRVTLASDIAFGMFSSPFQFPPRHKHEQSSRQRGENIAWATLQAGWWDSAEEKKISQITPPEEVLDFVRSIPELHDACLFNPGHLAGYVPQLLILTFSAEFSDQFDGLLAASEDEFRQGGPKWRSPDDEGALCAATLAFRHPTLGNHRPARIVDKWLSGHKGAYRAEIFPRLDYLFWLLSEDCAWLPSHIHTALLEGMKVWPYWWHASSNEETFTKDLRRTLFVRRRKPIKWTKALFSELIATVERSRMRANIHCNAGLIAQRFADQDFVGALDKWNTDLDQMRKKRGL